MNAAEHKPTIGIWLTTSVVVGTMIGAGIFLLPISLAPLGINAVVGWLLSAVGAMCIAFSLTRLVRSEGGGIQSYIEGVFGPTVAFIATWGFWVSAWTAVAATAIATAAALAHLFPAFENPWMIALGAIVTTGIIQAVNARGVRAAGEFAFVTTLIKILPLLAVIAAVLVRKSSGQPLSPLAPVPLSFNSVAAAVAFTLFAMLGFEGATAPVGKVRNPERTIPLAIVAGTSFVALLYLLGSTSVSLILSPEATASSTSPFADALVANFGETAAALAALAIAVAALGCANNNLLITGELGYSMGLRGDLPRFFARTDEYNAPILSQLVASGLAIVLILLNSSKSTAAMFTFVILLSTTATLYLYLIGAVAALRRDASWLVKAVISLSIPFCLFAFYGAGLEANVWGLVLLAIGLAIRWLCHRFNSSAATLPEAAPAAPPGSSA
ncbi:APC family permease [Sphingomonas alba]|uniref:Arginine/agmatine antiporter n=1 Tax=Sphingomonas alba TaxID=2908208 RepID=A0ABT0RKF5_9SPHN|nr:amino acid permease [Sphingomonas alba]MCL6683075.1 amino acid permease [Sphingomonas alba]